MERGADMQVEKRIDDLIEAGWHVLNSDFDTEAFQHWKKQAFNCLSALLGPDHTYTLYFKNYVREAEEKNLLAGGGILTAAKEEMAKRGPTTDPVVGREN
jgi:hypothetical protein